MKLKRFSKGKKKKGEVILICIIMLGISMIIKRTYAFFQNESEVRFINVKVRFPKASEVIYTTTSNTSVKNVEQAINDLYGKVGK